MPEDLLTLANDKDRRALKAIMRIYGDSPTDILNGLHALAARIAIVAGIEPEIFLAGMKHHWDSLAAAVNGEQPGNPH